MGKAVPSEVSIYRIWIADSRHWQPRDWHDVPPEAVAVEVADPGCFSPAQAATFLEGFNSQMLRDRQRLWAVAVPVKICYEGDLMPGQSIRATDALAPCASAR